MVRISPTGSAIGPDIVSAPSKLNKTEAKEAKHTRFILNLNEVKPSAD